MRKALKRKQPPKECNGCQFGTPRNQLVTAQTHSATQVSSERQVVVQPQSGKPGPSRNQAEPQSSTSEASSTSEKEPFLEKILETMRSLKETQERQGEKIEALMNTQVNNGRSMSAEDALKQILKAAKVC